MKTLPLCVALMFAGLLAACSSGSSNSTPTLTSIAVTPAMPSVAAGLPEAFTATGTYSNNTTQDLTATATWGSSNTAVATIAAGGAATTLTAGMTTISASVSGSTVMGSTTLTVTAPVLDSIAVTPANSTVPVGTLNQFTATGTYSNNTTQDLTATATWMSSNTAAVTIASTGIATALADTAVPVTITATSGTVSGSTGVSVASAILTKIVIPTQTVTIANGTAYQFTAFGYYNDGSKHNLTMKVGWTSTDTTVATIGAGTGRAQAAGVGSTTITATLGSVSGSATLNVTAATIQSITVGPSSTTIPPLTTEAFIAIGTFSDMSTQNLTQQVTWTSSKPAVATISNSPGSYGVATGVSPGGSTKISAQFAFGGASATGSAPLDVSSVTVSSIAVTPQTAGLGVGTTLPLQAVATFSDSSTQNIDTVATWSSSDTTVATVDSSGDVTGVATGSVTISAALDGVTSNSASLTVESVASIAVTPASGTVAEGTSIPFAATGTLTDGTTTQNLTSSVTWTSSDLAIATVSSASGSYGQVTGIAPGVAPIGASFSGLLGLASATVTDATLSSIAVKPPNPVIALGSNKQFTATGTFSDASTENLSQQVTWSSSDITVAIINNSGGVTTTGVGTATITATITINGLMVSGTTTLTVQ